MPEQAEKVPCGIALLAHVDAGKTTLCEALLYQNGALRELGRVDHGDTHLDTHALERQRGITIFSSQARFCTDGRQLTLLDTPGHVDFSAETERTLPVADCAVLVISASDGVQAHTLTLWRLLERYQVPTFLFINKMDLPDTDRAALLRQLRDRLDPGCADYSGALEDFYEAAALCQEDALEQYLQSGVIGEALLRQMIARRILFPCCFGSARMQQGIDTLTRMLTHLAPVQAMQEDFGARVYKISRDPQGNRLTWLKVTGGSLRVRQSLHTGQREEKVQVIRLYTGERFTTAEQVPCGTLCAVTGLSDTWAGQGLGCAAGAPKPLLQPVMSCRIVPDREPVLALPLLRQLEEEDPQLRLLWDGETGQISAQVMGKVQLEVLCQLVRQRFSMEITFSQPRICYQETIENTVEGVGHYEPLRHYAEVHILLEPLPRGSGIRLESTCSGDVLEPVWQKLILTHMGEKQHRGVLTGAPITDMKLTLVAGRAHLKHTEGGDMRQATYRAIRQGLMQAKSRLLEPWYDFCLSVPADRIGRAITDIRAMSGEFDNPRTEGDVSVLTGLVPAAQVGDYAQTVAAYTRGRGQLQLSLHGYLPCHNEQEVVRQAAYDPEADTQDSPGSIFCAHGAGFYVPWDKVRDYMHLESCLRPEKPQLLLRNLSVEDKELEAIMEREFGPIRRPQYGASSAPATEQLPIRPPSPQFLIVDGYNMIFAREELAQLARADLEAARRQLCDRLSSYAAYRDCRLVVVFDGYRVRGNPGEKQEYAGIRVVFTRENETADAYIESLAAQIGPNFRVRIATSDALVQLAGLRSGQLRCSARELWNQLDETQQTLRTEFQQS